MCKHLTSASFIGSNKNKLNIACRPRDTADINKIKITRLNFTFRILLVGSKKHIWLVKVDTEVPSSVGLRKRLFWRKNKNVWVLLNQIDILKERLIRCITQDKLFQESQKNVLTNTSKISSY